MRRRQPRLWETTRSFPWRVRRDRRQRREGGGREEGEEEGEEGGRGGRKRREHVDFVRTIVGLNLLERIDEKAAAEAVGDDTEFPWGVRRREDWESGWDLQKEEGGGKGGSKWISSG
jgi:hypothetical protein